MNNKTLEEQLRQYGMFKTFAYAMMNEEVKCIIRRRTRSGLLVVSYFVIKGKMSWDLTPTIAYLSGEKLYDGNTMHVNCTDSYAYSAFSKLLSMHEPDIPELEY